MTEEQQRIAIAEACGWTDCQHVESIGLTKGYPPTNTPPKYGTYENGMAQLPDYPNDLNAMHEAEKIFNHAQYCRYISELCTLTIADNNSMYMATAAQRAEAFLRTINKWTTN